MAIVACPQCGEEERLRGLRRGDAIVVLCNACGTSWQRDAIPKCCYCGSKDLRPTPMPVWSRGRGTMQTPAGMRDAWACESCGSTDVTREVPM